MKKMALLLMLCTAVIIGWRYLKEAEEFLEQWEGVMVCYE